MKTFYIKNSSIKVRKSNREYKFVLMRQQESGVLAPYSCHMTKAAAVKEMNSQISDYKRHPQDFSAWFIPTSTEFYKILELEAR